MLRRSRSATAAVRGFVLTEAHRRIRYRLVPSRTISRRDSQGLGRSKSISARFGVTSVVIENLIYSLGTGLFVLTGS